MKNKITSLMLLVALFTTMLTALPVSASDTLPDNIAEDYVAGEIQGNVITAEGLSANYNGVTGIGTVNEDTEDEAWTIGTSAQISDNAWGVGGAIIDKNGYDASVLSAGNSIVIGAKVRNNTGVPIIKTSAYQYSKSPLYSKEYPQNISGKKITNTEWEDFGTTLKFSETEFMGAGNTNLLIGLSYTGTTEAERAFEILKGSMYIGEEYAHDMIVEADSSLLMVGKSINVTAQVLNQAGSSGYLSQGVTWYVLNDERTQRAEGIIITETSANTAKISVSSGAAQGNYHVVAVADADSRIVKSVDVQLKLLTDYEPGEITGNVLTNPVTISKNYNGLSLREGESSKSYDVEVGTNPSGDVTLKAVRNLDDPHKVWTEGTDGIYTWDGTSMIYNYAFSGGLVSRDFGDDAGKKKNVVFSFKLKNSGSTSSPVVGFGRTNNGYANTSVDKAEYPVEYNSKDKGIAVSSYWTWTTFEGMFENTGRNTLQNYTYAIGLVQGNKKGAAVTVSADAYMGVEYGHDISLEAVSSTTWKRGATEEIVLDLDVINQLGKTGGLSQKATWYAMTDNRTQAVDGFEFLNGADGKVSVIVSDSVPAGTYEIVAVADENEELVKGIDITVKGRNQANQYLAMDFEDDDVSGAIVTGDADIALSSDGCGESEKGLSVTPAATTDRVWFPLRTVAGNKYKISLWVKPSQTPESQTAYFDFVNSAKDIGADVENTIVASKTSDFSAGQWTYVTAEYTATGTGTRDGVTVTALPDGEISFRIGDGIAALYVIDDFFVIPYVTNEVVSEEIIAGGNFDSAADLANWNLFIKNKDLSDEAKLPYYSENGYSGGGIEIVTQQAYDGFSTVNPVNIQLGREYEFSYYAKALDDDETVGKYIWNFISLGGSDYTGEIGKFIHITNTNNPTLTTEWQKHTFNIDLDYITADIPEIWIGFRVGDNAELTSGLNPKYAVDSISIRQVGDSDFSVESTLYGSLESDAVLQFNFLDSTKGSFVYRIVKETAQGDYVLQSDVSEDSTVEVDIGEISPDERIRLDLIGLDGYGNYSQVHTKYIDTEKIELTDRITFKADNYLWNNDIDTLSATLFCKSEEDLNELNVYGALYDENDKMQSFTKADIQVPVGSEDSVTATISTRDEEGNIINASKAKFFAWYDGTNAPAKAVCELEKTDGLFIYVDVNSKELAENGTIDSPLKSIEAARTSWQNALLASDKEDIYVVLKSGEYFLNEALAFTQEDCADGKTLTFTTLSGERADISGGKHISGFTAYKNGIYRAPVPAGTNSRQLYVNGIKATRARTIEDVKGFTNLDEGATKSTFENKGLICTDASYAGYKYPDELELAFIENWRHHYITVDTITMTDDGALFGFTENGNAEAWKKIVTLQTGATVPVYLENALELLDEPGEWYLDTNENYLYYMPRSFENMQTADVIIPVTQELVTLTGTVDNPVKNISFKNIDFVYSAWNYPTTNRNYMNSQGAFYGTQTTVPADTGCELPDGAMELTNVHNITIDNCDFAHLGSMAIRMAGAIQHCNIIGNEFYELAGAAMALGENEGENVRNPQEEKYFITDNLIANNYIHKVGDDYNSAAAISTGFPKNTVIRNNEMADGSYSGFHIGWGWTATSDAATENFVIEKNYIHNFMNSRIFDGAPIYTLGKTGGTEENPNIIRRNYIQDTQKGVAGIYPDQGSTFWEISENVIDSHRYSYVFSDKESSATSPTWLNIWEYRISDIYVKNNYSTTANYRNEGTRVQFEQAHIYPDANWPDEALEIIAESGIEKEYRDRFDFDIQILTVPTRLDIDSGKTIPFAYNAVSTKGKLCDLSGYEITATSSDESVAVATRDTVTGVSAGKAWITYEVYKKDASGKVTYYDKHRFCVVVK